MPGRLDSAQLQAAIPGAPATSQGTVVGEHHAGAVPPLQQEWGWGESEASGYRPWGCLKHGLGLLCAIVGGTDRWTSAPHCLRDWVRDCRVEGGIGLTHGVMKLAEVGGVQVTVPRPHLFRSHLADETKNNLASYE